MTSDMPTPQMEKPQTPDDTASLPRAVLIVLLLMVGAVAVRFGMEVLLLARKGEMRDFAAYYTAAVVAKSGASFYDPQPKRVWFLDNDNPDLIATAKQLGTMHRHDSFEHVHIFSYPPAMMFIMLPLASAPLHVAKLAWLVLLIVAIGFGMWLLARTLRSGLLITLCMVFLAVTFHPIRNTLDLGQVNAVIFLFLALFFALYRQGRDTTAGVILGVVTALRFHPGFLILYLFWRREFRPALVALATACAVSVLALFAFGIDQSVMYFTQVAPKFSTALVSIENHSLAGFLATVGRAMGLSDPSQPVSSPWTARIAAGLVLTASALLLPRVPAPRHSRTATLEFALILVMIPLATPNAWINHLVTIIPSLWILFDNLVKEESPRGILRPCLAGAATIMIGVVDDFYMHPLLAHGALVLVSEIKFYGLALVFLTLGWMLRDARGPRTY